VRTSDRRLQYRAMAAAAFAALGPAMAACGDEPQAATAPEVATMLEHLPGDASAVIGIRASRAREVPALAGLLEWLPEEPVGAAIARHCGLGARSGIDLAVAAIGGDAAPARAFVAMRGSFTRDSVATCVTELATVTGEPIAVTREGSVTAYSGRVDRRHVYWSTPEVAIVAPQADDAPAALGALFKQSGVTTSSELMSYVGRVRTGAAFWMAGPLPPEVQKRMAGLGPGVPALRGFYLSADGDGDGVRVSLGLRLASDKEAEAAARAFRAQRGELARAAPEARAVVDKIEVARSGTDLALDAVLTAEEAKTMIDLVAGLTGLPRGARAKP
jgi:hypothetical protein